MQGLGEPQWLPEDAEAALWWQHRERDRCRCGYPRSESMAEDGPSYEAEMVRCFACQARDAKAAEVNRDADRDRTISYGAYFRVREVPEDGDIP